jgi:hypothetical protein
MGRLVFERNLWGAACLLMGPFRYSMTGWAHWELRGTTGLPGSSKWAHFSTPDQNGPSNGWEELVGRTVMMNGPISVLNNRIGRLLVKCLKYCVLATLSIFVAAQHQGVYHRYIHNARNRDRGTATPHLE